MPLAQVDNLVALMRLRAQESAHQTAVVFADKETTYGQLWHDTNSFAAQLQSNGLQRGDRVVLQLPNSAEFFQAYYGVQLLGAVAVPIFHGSSVHRLAMLIQLCGAKAVVVDSMDVPNLESQLADELKGPSPCVIDLRADRPSAVPENLSDPLPSHLAMLQYTSGTTGNPKGVMLTHGNLLANVRQMIPVAQFVTEDVFVSWLPVYHDMGLITMTMCPFYLGAKLVLLPVSPKPFPWFSAIEKYGGTMTASPDFGYRFATKFTRRSKYDLSSLRRALIAAEPVRESTIQRFEDKFGVKGVLKPGYGLAEASVAASFWSMDSQERLIDADGHVSAGKAIPNMDIAIIDNDQFVPAGDHGEIVIRGENCTQGYYRNPTATQDLSAPDGFIRTGDMGYLDQDGHLFIIGRAKNIIIRAGRNLAPREIEEAAEEISGVRMAAAIGIDAGGIEGEQIILCCEVERGKATNDQREQLIRDIQTGLHQNLGYRPDKVVLVKAQTIPRTYNGKLQYNALKRAYLADSLETT